MPVVFVHGVPETPVVWKPLVEALGVDEPILLQLPGFGCPRPPGHEGTMDEYADWLTGELSAIDGPIDLVSHDWGALLAMRVLASRSDLARTWVTDFGNLDDDFEWHDTAKTWQTPGDGEAFMDGFLGGSDADRAELLVGLGVAEPVARDLASGIDAEMGDSILRLYRSATEVGPQWGPGIDAITTRSLVVEAMEDPFHRESAAAQLVERIGAHHLRLEHAGHWWMTGDPATAAAAIREFWSAV